MDILDGIRPIDNSLIEWDNAKCKQFPFLAKLDKSVIET